MSQASVADAVRLAVQALHAQWFNEDLEIARLDAEQLVCLALERDRTYLFAHANDPLEPAQLQRLTELLAERLRGVPLAYLSGEREFWSLPLEVGPGVLVPRADTETLIEQALADLGAGLVPDQGLIVDAGCGSGAIALALASEQPRAVLAIDNATAALAMTRRNRDRLRARLQAELRVERGDWLCELADQSVALLVCNPPYLAADDPHLTGDSLLHEPRSALVSGRDGLLDLYRLIEDLPRVLAPGAIALLEHGAEQGAAVRAQAAMVLEPFSTDISTVSDLAGRERLCRIKLTSNTTRAHGR